MGAVFGRYGVSMRAFNGRYNPKSDTYTTGTRQRITNLHKPHQCQNEGCVIHHPSEHNMRRLPTHWRQDRGIMERICNHGTGHPDPDSPWPANSYQWVHGCCGCCGLDKPHEVVVERKT